MERLEEHDVKFCKREDGRIIAKMEDPPVEGHGDDIAEALDDLAYEIRQFSEGVWEAFEQSIISYDEDFLE